MAMITALRPETFTRLQLNAGAFLRDFDYSSATDASSLRELIKNAVQAGTTKTLGATRGGGSFTMTPTVRQIEVDGKRGEFVGSTINDGYVCNMTGTMLEFHEDTLTAMGGKLVTEGAKEHIKQIKFPTEFKDEMYIPSLVWVGDMGDGKVLLIDLQNALNTAGVSFTFTDKGEGTMPFTFVAHAGDVEDIDYAPASVYIFENAQG